MMLALQGFGHRFRSGARHPHLGAIIGVIILVSLLIYAYLAFCLQTIANRLNQKNPWLAWIPVVNLWYIVVLAQRSGWLVLVFLIPGSNHGILHHALAGGGHFLLRMILPHLVWQIFLVYFIWLIAKRLGKPGWVSLLMFIPIVNLVIPAYLAFG